MQVCDIQYCDGLSTNAIKLRGRVLFLWKRHHTLCTYLLPPLTPDLHVSLQFGFPEKIRSEFYFCRLFKT